MKTIHYAYRQRVQFEGESLPRYVIPLADPNEFEHPFDHIFDTPEEAHEHMEECLAEELYGTALEDIREDLVLVKVSITPSTPKCCSY